MTYLFLSGLYLTICVLTDDFRWKVTETLEKHDRFLTSLPLTCRPQSPIKSICSAAFLSSWPSTKDSRPCQENSQVLHYSTGMENFCWISTNPVYSLANQQWSLYTCMNNDFFSFSPAYFPFSSYCLSPSDTAHGKGGSEDSSVCFLEPSVARGHLHWCHVKLRFRPGSNQWVRSAEHAGTFIYYSLISVFLTSCLPCQKEPDKFSLNKRKYWPISDTRIVSALLIDSRGISGSGLDSGADGSCGNTAESWQMRMFRPQKLLPCCNFYKPKRAEVALKLHGWWSWCISECRIFP